MAQECRKEDATYQNWVKAMELGERLGCHQKPERSLYVKGYQMPVCARCFGVFIGYLIGAILYFVFGFDRLKQIGLMGLIVMFVDWFLQAAKIVKSSNPRRIVTGIFAGIGYIVFFFKGIGWCKDFFIGMIK